MISVIVPSLNEGKSIRQTLRALKKQDYEGEYEIIVADGGSEDDTIKIAKEEKVDKIVKVKGKGIAKGRNDGASASKGEILLFVDADTPPYFNALTELGQAYKEKNVVGVSTMALPTNYSFRNSVSYWLFNKLARISTYIGRPLLPGFFLSCKRNIFDKIGGFDERLMSGEDLDFSWKLGKFGKCKFLDTTFVYTSSRRLDEWGINNYLYRYFKGYFFGKLFNKGEYEPVR